MNTRQLQYAIELYKALNFSIVADRLKISQPALSKQIAALENDLGIKLFDRTTNPLTVTPAGEHFFAGAVKLLYQEDQLLRSMEDSAPLIDTVRFASSKETSSPFTVFVPFTGA